MYVPLSRQQVIDFIRDGFVVVQPSVPGGDMFHEHLWEAAEDLYRTGEFGNNLLSKVPALDAVIDSPEIVGALTGFLGEDYVLSPCRHCHIAMAEASGNQRYHLDGFDRYRHVAPTDLMVMYYPQAVTEDMGPTVALPGSHYCRERPRGIEHMITLVRPGGCVIMHFHLWHRATARLHAGRARYMYKLLFRRCRPFLPPPAALQVSMWGENPFLSEGRLSFDDRGLACAAIWSALSGNRLPDHCTSFLRGMQSCNSCWMALGAASGAWSSQEALAAFERALPAAHPFVKCSGADRIFPPVAAVKEHGQHGDAIGLLHVAGALQVCANRNGAGAVALTTPSATIMVHPTEQEWLLETLGALPMILPIGELLVQLVPLLAPGAQCVRTQTRALISIYDAGVKCGAPCSPAWCEAAGRVAIEEALLACVECWQSFLLRAKGTMVPHELASARYTLAEALRCVGRFCSIASASSALSLIGAADRGDLLCSPEWRQGFTRYVERRRRCPITSLASLF